MIAPETIREVTDRIDIVDVVGEFVKLRRRGSNYLGLCPFHGEKTPSFNVSQSKGIFKCFGCGKSGNAITFVMEHEKYSYVEAIKWLARRYGIAVEETAMSDQAREQMQAAESLYIVNGFAQQFFHEQLVHSEEGEHIALSYLKERGFNRPIIEKFGLGYNPDQSDSLSKEAVKQQFSRDILLKSGLVRSYQDRLQDNYRGRIIFPIHNNSGKVIGFGARIIGKKDKAPKYINTPENEIYVKSRILYGSYFARHAIDKENECLLVEGYTDVLGLAQAGIENVVASGGTSLTIEQLRLIKKYTQNLTIIYDGDNAGIKAALRGLDMALEEGLNVRLVLIPDGEDPDSYVRSLGAEKFRNFIQDNKKDFILFQLEILLKDAGTDITKKNDAVNRIAESLSKISKAEDFTKQQEYIRQCSDVLKIDEHGLTTLVNKYRRDQLTKLEKKQNQDQRYQPDEPGLPPEYAEGQPEDIHQSAAAQELATLDTGNIQEKNLLRVLLDFGLRPWKEKWTIADYIFDEIQGFPFENELNEKLLEYYRKEYNEGREPDVASFQYIEDKSLQELVVSITLTPYEISRRWDEKIPGKKSDSIVNRDLSRQDAQNSVIYFKLRKIKQMLEITQKEIMDCTDFEEQLKQLSIQKHLKQEEKNLTDQLGTVIFR
ncbi:DNA primase [Arachidicoccus rhizosphaerae]|uniref:DNA primase n=1 Tax=Arachidicoccus rhizosphaerae TaxID=551991 RepID=A0A1H4AE21_9BACT|nr:DNA primase [Arachidicoccus rhizosphaerae]SEA34363.1 DNA primase [Arachidicoccus rhizosphaerae]